MPLKPNVISQLTVPGGLTRLGGMASRGSAPGVASPIAPAPKVSAMENAMLKTMKPDPKKLFKGKSQAFNKSATKIGG
jgi:hypothetical protein